MKTKLTLTIDQSLIEKAKEYARSQGRSLSDIIENYLRVIIQEEQTKASDSTPITSSLRGSFIASKDFDYEKKLTKALSKKYLQHGSIDAILTRNLKDYSRSEIGVMTPESYIKMINSRR